MLPYPLRQHFRPSDLKKLSDEQIEEIKKLMEVEESRRKFWTRLEVAVEAVNTGHEYFRAAGLALLHILRIEVKALKPAGAADLLARIGIQLPEDFSAKDHAYALADMYERLSKNFDEYRFVAGLTHYDEWNNGMYFRRS
jgi:hypothetical protein